MQPYYEDEQVALHLGKSEQVLPTLAADSVDAVVTDPPYELGFMGKTWDATGIAYSVDLWREVLRVLKPGGHLLAFGGTRTVHRMTCAIEDAGFEIRDGIDWLYGQGFPKGQDIGKAIDRMRGDGDAIRRVTAYVAEARRQTGVRHKAIDDAFGTVRMANHWMTQGRAACVPTIEQWERLRALLGFGDEMDAEVARLNGRKGEIGENFAAREVTSVGHRVRRASDVQIAGLSTGAYDITAPASEAARQWHGWNTALKPAREPIVVARKGTGFNTTVANVLEHGTGALNIDSCRIETSGRPMRTKLHGADTPGTAVFGTGLSPESRATGTTEAGRWPTNVVLSHAGNEVDGDLCADGCVPGCPVADLDAQSGVLKAGERPANRVGIGDGYGLRPPRTGTSGIRQVLDTGGASRFFPVFRYEAKAPTSERPKVDGEAHATVKPLALMRWLVQLVTPPGGTVLEPFAGSGTTVEACLIEGFRCMAVEKEAKYLPLIMSRISKPIEPVLFGSLDECEGAP